MIAILKTVLPFLLAFTAISLAFVAVRIGRHGQPPADPFFRAFGRAPGFTAEQLRRIAPPVRSRDPLRRSFSHGPFANPAGLALRTDAGSDGPFVPSDPAAARNLYRGPRHG